MKPVEEQTPQQPAIDAAPPAVADDAQSPAPVPQADAELAATGSTTQAAEQPNPVTTDTPPAPEPDTQASDSNPDQPPTPAPTIITPDHPIERDEEDEPPQELYIRRKPSQEQLMSVWLSVASLATFAIGLTIDYAPLVSILLAVMAVYSAIGNKFIAGIVLSMSALALSGGFFALTTIIK